MRQDLPAVAGAEENRLKNQSAPGQGGVRRSAHGVLPAQEWIRAG